MSYYVHVRCLESWCRIRCANLHTANAYCADQKERGLDAFVEIV